ncbi:hypothetical protein JCM19300_3593 [Algibacter lectus]|uniref:Uncharacterized protein n=1 Tax=Algibacter lectus TaxID=221126 RepID=A0A090V6W5_9FLAO|nr:hypothetical protein JCM19300_3593 [Algibacter lectus]
MGNLRLNFFATITLSVLMVGAMRTGMQEKQNATTKTSKNDFIF